MGDEATFDSASDEHYEQIECDPTYTPEELITINRLSWAHKSLGTTTTKIMTHVKFLTKAVSIITLLLASQGGVDAIGLILDYLTPKELVIVAAASDNLLMCFFTPENKYGKKLENWIRAEFKTEPNMTYLCSLPNGQALKRELKLFNMSHSIVHTVDDFCNLPITLPKNEVNAQFNPVYPIVALHQRVVFESLNILAYSGNIRKTYGQTLFQILKCAPYTIKFFSWNSTGSFLLVATTRNPGFIIKFSICTTFFKKNIFLLRNGHD